MTVTELFKQIGITANIGKVRWGTTFNCSLPGIYIVSTSGDPNAGLSGEPRFDEQAIQSWIDRLPDFTLDDKKPTVETLVQRLRSFWLPEENVLYIGKTDAALKRRVNAYYKTELGARKPHSGGQWLKTLRNIDELFVYYAPTDRPEENEAALLKYFYDSAGELPFANLEGPYGRKPHGLRNQRDSK